MDRIGYNAIPFAVFCVSNIIEKYGMDWYNICDRDRLFMLGIVRIIPSLVIQLYTLAQKSLLLFLKHINSSSRPFKNIETLEQIWLILFTNFHSVIMYYRFALRYRRVIKRFRVSVTVTSKFNMMAKF